MIQKCTSKVKKRILFVLGVAIILCTLNGLMLANEAINENNSNIPLNGPHHPWIVDVVNDYKKEDNAIKVPTAIIVGTQKGVSSHPFLHFHYLCI